MLKFKALTPAVAAVVLTVSTGASFAQYKGPPVIVQTPTLPQQQPTVTLTPTLSPPTLTPSLPPPVAAPVPAKPATPAQPAPARP